MAALRCPCQALSKPPALRTQRAFAPAHKASSHQIYAAPSFRSPAPFCRATTPSTPHSRATLPPAATSTSSPEAATSTGTGTSRTETELKEGIATFYDTSSPVWEEVWGEHMHHGYYKAGESKDHKVAQVDMIEETLRWAGVSDKEDERPCTILDAGCGIGGSSRHLARKYGASVVGITLSPLQAGRATAISEAAGLKDKVSFQVADAMAQPFEDGQFDLVWSMESGEHMPDKEKFVRELARVTAPGGRIIIVTWCHRDLQPGEARLTASEKDLLDRLCDAYYLPAWCSASDYVRIASETGLESIRSADWSEFVTPFWPAVMVSALSLKGLVGLAKAGWTTIKGALAMGLMVQGFSRGLIKFAIITATKPKA